MPKFIDDYPIGEDLFEGKSQEKIANNIVSYMTDNSTSRKRVIGIEGEWGAGKSNVIEMITTQTKADWHLFTFDAWGHQEDLTRRTFLEELTDELIEKKLLPIHWEQTLKERLATNKITTKQDVPSFNPRIIAITCIILFTPLLREIFEYLFIIASSQFYGFWSYLFTGIFSALAIVFCLQYNRGKEKLSFGHLLYVYQGKQITTNLHETITSLEPTVREFRRILNDIVKEIKEGKKLIFVFDNMDRLPSEKIKEIWSSIHTFFAEVKSNTMESWVLIPYDQKHICKVFGKESDADLTVSYIQKTFSIVFRISPPILSDWKGYFKKKFKEAFGFFPPEDQQLDNLFDYLNSDTTIKPRQIISFINNLVSLNKQWGEKIPLKYCGLFILTQEDILQDPIKKILERSCIKKVESLFAGDDKLETYLSALVFNVDVDRADEVLLRRSIEQGFRGEIDFKDLYKHPAFLSVLESVFYSVEISVDKTVLSFDELPNEVKHSNDFAKYWDELQRKFKNSESKFPECENLYKHLLENLSNNEKQKQLTKSFLYKITKYNDDKDNIEHVGSKFSSIIDNLILYLNDKKIDIPVLSLIPKTVFKPEEYIDFVNSCNYNFKEYSIQCDSWQLNDFFLKVPPQKYPEYGKFFGLTKGHFDFSKLLTHVEEGLNNLDTNIIDWENEVTGYLGVRKILSEEMPIPYKLNSDTAFRLLSSNDSQPSNIDLAFSLISDPDFVSSEDITYSYFETLLSSENELERGIKIVDYYLSYPDLTLLASKHKWPLLCGLSRKIMKSQTKFSFSESSMDAIIANYGEIRTEVLLNDNEWIKDFLMRLNESSANYAKVLGEKGFVNFVSLEFIQDCSLINNELTKLTIGKANDFITSASENHWVEAFKDTDNSYLFSMTMHFIEAKIHTFKLLPEQATNAYKGTLLEILENENYPDNLVEWDTILEFMDGKRLGTTYKKIRDKFIYTAEDVSPEAMLFFERGLFLYGGLNEADKIQDVVRKIILPCIKDADSLKDVILRNTDAVVKIIKAMGDNDLSIEIKDAIKEKIGESFENIESLASQLGLVTEDATDFNPEKLDT